MMMMMERRMKTDENKEIWRLTDSRRKETEMKRSLREKEEKETRRETIASTMRVHHINASL